MRRNTLAIRAFRRLLTASVACRRLFRKSGGGGNCTCVRREMQSVKMARQ